MLTPSEIGEDLLLRHAAGRYNRRVMEALIMVPISIAP